VEEIPNCFSFKSNNNGTSWTAVNNGLTNLSVQSFAVSGTNIFAGTTPTGGGVFLSTDNGNNWYEKNEGFSVSPSVNALLIANNYIFAGTGLQAVWRRPLSELITSNQNINNEIPSMYSLSQNYPNPFNPSTNIKFAIPRSSDVKIAIYDISGKEIDILVNEKLQPGTYQTEWNASNYPSGIYFYKITSNEFSVTKRMTLIK
jgi:hypothetical protein